MLRRYYCVGGLFVDVLVDDVLLPEHMYWTPSVKVLDNDSVPYRQTELTRVRYMFIFVFILRRIMR